ncbi:hypothetical protein [Miltoncostaea marina]|uniref:hypothetical protein n=1 Tax=Miltoncostaea marina TaxID=2843215 RepID=UPI001C3CD0C8|nr:hypothetical protein [Miltoncostaea marina]
MTRPHPDDDPGPADAAMTFDECVHPGLAAAITMRPLVERTEELLADAGVTDEVVDAVVAALAEGYVAGVTDGARDAVGQLAGGLAAKGIDVRLGPELLAVPDDPGGA